MTRWLKLNGQCPICRVRIDERMSAENIDELENKKQRRSDRTPSEISRKPDEPEM